MKNILILSYDFKPLNTIGANRTNSWFTYFSKYNLNPIVFTRKWSHEIKTSNDYLKDEEGQLEKEVYSNGIIYRAPFKKSFFEKLNFYLTNNNLSIIRKLVTVFSILFTHVPFFNIEKLFYLKHVSEILKNEKIDFIITSGEPFILFKFAAIISKKYNIPYIIDFRDAWSLNPMSNNRKVFKLLNKVNGFYEKKYIKNSMFFSTVSEIIANDIKKSLYKKDSIIIENGYDKEMYDSIQIVADKEFTVVYTGSLYDVQPVDSFLIGVEKFIIENKSISIKVLFIGVLFRANKYNSEIICLTKKYPNIFKIIGKVSLKESIEYQKKASILLKFSLKSPLSGFYGGKLYEYYACDKPILNIVHKQEYAVTDFFPDNNIQKFAFSMDTVALQLQKLYDDFTSKKENFIKLTNQEKKKFSREEMTKKLAHKILEY